MKNPKLTIIVPIYKVEAYLDACMDRILQQTFTDFELILVDDGSPDRCGEMCDEYAKKDSRIVVIHKANGGLSDARNAGLDIARGEYITFIDSDDEYGSTTTIEENMQILLEDDSVDIVQFPVALINFNGDIKLIHTPSEDKLLFFNEEEYLRRMLEGSVNNAVWNKIYKKYIFDIHRFPVGKIYEDFFLNLNISDKFHKMVLSNRSFYNYYERKGSILHSKRTKNEITNIIESEILLFEKIAKYPSLSKSFIVRYSHNISVCRSFRNEYDIREIVSVFNSVQPPIIYLLANLFLLPKHVAKILLFSIFKSVAY